MTLLRETVAAMAAPLQAVGTSSGGETARLQERLLELGFWVAGRLAGRQVPLYVAAQCVGGLPEHGLRLAAASVGQHRQHHLHLWRDLAQGARGDARPPRRIQALRAIRGPRRLHSACCEGTPCTTG